MTIVSGRTVAIISLECWREAANAVPEMRIMMGYSMEAAVSAGKPDAARATLGQRIRAARIAAGFTQRDVGEKIGVRKQTISLWEKGHNAPEMDNLAAFAAAVGVGAGNLMEGIEEAILTQGDVGKRLAASSHLIPMAAGLEAAALILEGDRADAERFVATFGHHGNPSVAVRIKDRAMHPLFRDGDIITLDGSIEPEPGELVLARADGVIMIRRWVPVSRSKAKLTAESPHFPDVDMGKHDGVIGVMRERISTWHE